MTNCYLRYTLKFLKNDKFYYYYSYQSNIIDIKMLYFNLQWKNKKI